MKYTILLLLFVLFSTSCNKNEEIKVGQNEKNYENIESEAYIERGDEGKFLSNTGASITGESFIDSTSSSNEDPLNP